MSVSLLLCSIATLSKSQVYYTSKVNVFMMYQINSISHNKSPAICLQNFRSELSTRSFSNEILGADFCAPKESFDAELPLKKKSSVLRIKICFFKPHMAKSSHKTA